VERFRLIKPVSVRCTFLVAVQVIFCVPARTVPQSRVACVSTGQRVKRGLLVVSVRSEARLTLDRGESESSGVLEKRVVTIAVIRSRGEERFLERNARECRGRLITSSNARMVQEIGLRTVASARCFTCFVFLRNQRGIESCSGEIVCLSI